MTPSTTTTKVALGVLLACCVSTLHAQRRDDADRRDARASMSFPGNQQMLKLQVSAPAEVRVRNSFDYEIHVTNTTENVMLREIHIAQEATNGIEVEQGRIGEKNSEHKKNADEKQPNKKSKESDDNAKGDSKKQPKEQPADNADKKAKSKSQSGQKGWKIAELRPGETKVIHVTATSDQEGEAETCLVIKSYQPALCFTTNFTKPELDITIEAPEEATVCEPFEIEYFVRNPGSGDLKKLRLQAELPSGLELVNGKKKIDLPIDGLAAGDVRKFVAQVVASKAGDYSTRATATAPSDLSARSEKRSIKIRAPRLAVAIDGPDELYLGRQATYTVRITNQGNAPARDTELNLQFPQSAGLVSTGEVRDTDKAVEKQKKGKSQAQPQPAKDKQAKDKQAKDKQAKNKQSQQSQRPADYADETWEIGDLQPGESKMVQVKLNPNDAEKMELQAEAAFICGAESKSERVSTVATTSTKVLAVPALAIAVIDEQDPVAVGEEVTYRVVLRNEGTAAAEGLDVKINLPESLSFVKANGPTEANSSEGSVQFKTLKKLSVDDEVTWEVRLKVEKPDDVRFPVHVTLKDSDRPIKAEEPTRLIRQ